VTAWSGLAAATHSCVSGRSRSSVVTSLLRLWSALQYLRYGELTLSSAKSMTSSKLRARVRSGAVVANAAPDRSPRIVTSHSRLVPVLRWLTMTWRLPGLS